MRFALTRLEGWGQVVLCTAVRPGRSGDSEKERWLEYLADLGALRVAFGEKEPSPFVVSPSPR